jgi:hypothetical protein
MRFHFLVVSAIIWILFTGTGFAQTFTGTLDGYWSYNTNTPAFQLNSFRAFDIHDQAFSLNYGELAVAYKPKDVGFRVDVGFGDAADIVLRNTGDSQTWRHIQQAYLTGTHGKFTVDFGKWVTPIGAEVIETKDNWNYTRGLLFTFATPFYHFGARGTFVADERATVAGYVVNGWNNVRDQNLQSFTATAQFPWSDLTLWTEYRRDWSTESIFNKTQGEDSSVLDNQNTITFGLTYVFETAR